MKVIRGLHNLRQEHKGCVATIGNFDGVHLGHQQLIDKLKQRANSLSLPVTVIVFEPQPREFFDRDGAPGRVTRFRDKIERLKVAGVDQVLCLGFNESLRSLTAADFVQQLLIEKLAVKYLVVGDDFRFGCDRSGDFEFLTDAAKEFGFDLKSMATLSEGDVRISSTAVRQVLEQADFEQAETLLGWPYAISGKVVHGRKLGRQIGAPTANVQLAGLKSPFSGVFAVKVNGAGLEQAIAVANLGIKPTVNGVLPSLEVHLLSEGKDLYGQRISVTFCHKLRDEKKFDGIEQLQAQIAQDIQSAKDWFLNKD